MLGLVLVGFGTKFNGEYGFIGKLNAGHIR